MKTSDFDYQLPKELIAQNPIEPRDHSRLMVINRVTGERDHTQFYKLGENRRHRIPANQPKREAMIVMITTSQRESVESNSW